MQTQGIEEHTTHSSRNACVGIGLTLTRALSGFVWCETFVIVGIQCFWVLFKSSPFATDNVYGAIHALVPFLALFCLGLGAMHGSFRNALIRQEGPLHGLAGLAQWVVLMYAVWRDPFTCLIPLSATTLPWSLALSLVLAANMSTHLREQAAGACTRSKSRTIATPLLALLWWAGTLWACSGMPNLALFLTGSIVLHAAMVPLAMRTRKTQGEARLIPAASAEWFAVQAGMLLWWTVLSVVHVVVAFNNPVIGGLEAKAPLFLAVYYSPLFLLGGAVFLVAARFRLTTVIHLAVVALLVASVSGLTWSISFIAGYACAALFEVTRRQGPCAFALSCLLMTASWVFGLACFAFSGTLIAFEFANAIVQPITKWGTCALVLLCGAWLVATCVARRRSVPATAACARPMPSHPVWVWCVLLGVTVVLNALVLGSTAWPPFVLLRPLRLAVGEPMGLCHASAEPTDPAAQALDDLGVQSIRMNFKWTQIQPEPARWNETPFDKDLEQALHNGRHVVGVFDYDNNGVEQDPFGRQRDHYIAPSDIRLFTEYVRHVIARYGDRVSTWEIWNEPNIQRFWTGSMAEFCELARQTADAIRETQPHASIVGTAMTSPMGVVTAGGMEALHASGALARVDRPSGHLYLTDPRHFYNEYWKLIGTARRFGHPGSVCITELGSPDGGFYPWRSDDDLLAAYAFKAYTIGTNLGVSLMNWYCMRDDPIEKQRAHPGNSELFFGLLRADNSWKSSAYAYRLFSRYCTRCEIRNDLVQVSGGLAARQLRSTLYRREGGESTLVLWFEPVLRPGAHTRVRLDLGTLNEPAVWHDIASDKAKPWLDNEIDVSEKPFVLTFRHDESGGPIRVVAVSAPPDGLWLLSLFVLAAGAVGCGYRMGARPGPDESGV